MASTEIQDRREGSLPRLSWGAVISGVLLALAVHVVMGLLGGAIGFAAQPADSGALGAGAAIWALLTPFVATLLGAWLAVRMAGREDAAGANLHGVIVWCIGLLAGAVFLAGTLATGAMAAGASASGNAGVLRQMGIDRTQVAPRTELAADQASKAAAAAAGGGAMAALCGLLGAFAGSAIARRRGERRGLGWRIAVHRTHDVGAGAEHPAGLGVGSAYGTRVPPAGRDPRTEIPGAPPADPYHH
ncbi:hypothetical protein [Anaeromyxobacter dehalogenans]|uniref:Uncharacterized protein n=1 Tax=Anaeromyxobacter dehalogenans (strain 2CP-C) TaxID=290397 RepID=Q2IQF9_ANADE|nr:hypothetical protein [Anaeromyxobacter dehalogenans]ABC81037.1 hypothetical protein Adeh_1263 [Anaeromyxobacter dehalogenans 2CP-C]